MAMDVPVKCRRCGKTAPASEFTIDADYKMAVCRACVKDKKNIGNTSSQNSGTPSSSTERPASWNKVNEKIERDIFEKQEMTNEKILKTCYKCNYKFKYNPSRNFPNRCPFCGSPVKF